MKSLFRYFSLLALLITAGIMFSCDDDDAVGDELHSYGGKNVIKTVWFQSYCDYQTIPLPEELGDRAPKCNVTWLSAVVQDGCLTVNVDEYAEGKTDDRVATITFSNSKDKVIVVQSKYKEGDLYDVNGYAGTVVCMKDSIRLVASTLLGELPWSIYQNKLYNIDNYDDGMENTLKMKEYPYYMQEFPALAVIDALNILCFGSNKVTKWYLPAINELTLAYSHTGKCNWGWSSTEKDILNAQYNDYSRYWGWDKSKIKYVYAFYRF